MERRFETFFSLRNRALRIPLYESPNNRRLVTSSLCGLANKSTARYLHLELAELKKPHSDPFSTVIWQRENNHLDLILIHFVRGISNSTSVLEIRPSAGKLFVLVYGKLSGSKLFWIDSKLFGLVITRLLPNQRKPTGKAARSLV